MRERLGVVGGFGGLVELEFFGEMGGVFGDGGIGGGLFVYFFEEWVDDVGFYEGEEFYDGYVVYLFEDGECGFG